MFHGYILYMLRWDILYIFVKICVEELKFLCPYEWVQIWDACVKMALESRYNFILF